MSAGIGLDIGVEQLKSHRTRRYTLNWRGPPPRPHESVWGVLQKLVHQNALNANDLRRLLFPRPDPLPVDYAWRQSLWMNWCDLDRLRSLLPDTGGLWPIRFSNGGSMAIPSWERGYKTVLRYCAGCLEYGFHSVLFQMPEQLRCPEHDEPLRRQCPRCEQEIEYGREKSLIRPFECRCGHLLWAQRDSVAQWYPPPGWGRRLDALVRRVVDAASPNNLCWRLDEGYVPTRFGEIPGREVTVGPQSLFLLPRVYRRMQKEIVETDYVRERVDLACALVPIQLPLVDLCQGLVDDASRYIVAATDSHRDCIAKAQALSVQEGLAVRREQCVIANAVALWQRYWNETRSRRVLFDLLFWLVLDTVTVLQSRQIVPGPACTAEATWPQLWKVIGQRVLVSSFTDWLTLVDCIRAFCEPRGIDEWLLSNYEIPFEPSVPPIWASPASRALQYLDVCHEGHRELSRWNQRGCHDRMPPKSSGWRDNDIREALDRCLRERKRREDNRERYSRQKRSRPWSII